MIEVKAPGKKPRELQLYRIEEVKKFGVLSYWFDDFDKFKETFFR